MEICNQETFGKLNLDVSPANLWKENDRNGLKKTMGENLTTEWVFPKQKKVGGLRLQHGGLVTCDWFWKVGKNYGTVFSAENQNGKKTCML